MQKKDSFLNPQSLKTILIILLIVVAGGLGALFYFGLNGIKQYAIEVNHRTDDAAASEKQVEELQVLKRRLAQSQLLIGKANQLSATQENFQAQALTDIRAIADHAGVSIASTQFSAATEDGGHSLIIKLNSPVSYRKLITFFDGIESNLPKMQITSVTLGHVTGGSADSVKTENINIKLTVK